MSDRSEFDTIIIGSGAGGLAAAICLSRAGQQVLVLEQHDVPGGWCHSFYLNGHRFTPGVHYIGLVGEGGSTSNLYEGLGIGNELAFFRMNPTAYEHCHIGDERVDLPANFDDLIATLSERFPKEKKGIAKYLKTVKQVCDELMLIPKMNGFWDNITIPWRTRHLGKYGLFSLKTVIDWHIKDPVLKNVLNIQCGDHGLPPAKSSFPLHCAVMSHYFDGGYYPMGGGGAIVKAMTNAIKRHGGEVRTSQFVKRILLDTGDGKRAIGVELASGERILSKRVISNADPAKTYLDMVGKEHLSPKLVERLQKTTYSCTSLMLFLTVDMDVRAAGLDSGNIWIMPDMDLDDFYVEMMDADIGSGQEFNGMFVSCTTLKDPSSFDGVHHCIEAITFIDHAAFDRFKDEVEQRTPAYLQFKEKLMQKIINRLEKVVPGISAHIVHKELGTPLTNEHYINATNGCVYGTEKTFKQTGPFAYRAKSEIKDLYLCGASIISHGVAGAAYSGVNTAAAILNCRQEDLIKKDPGQRVKIHEAESDADYPEELRKKIEVRKRRAASVVRQ